MVKMRKGEGAVNLFGETVSPTTTQNVHDELENGVMDGKRQGERDEDGGFEEDQDAWVDTDVDNDALDVERDAQQVFD